MTIRWAYPGREAVLATLLCSLFTPLCTMADASEALPRLTEAGPGEASVRSALGGRRLFFTAEQRLAARRAPELNPQTSANDANDANDASTAESATQGMRQGDTALPMQAAESRRFADHSSAPDDTVGLVFDALVSGPRGTRLLVNGLPCEPLSSSSGSAEETGIRLDCPFLSGSRPSLSLVLLADRLRVLESRSLLGVIDPGQGL